MFSSCSEGEVYYRYHHIDKGRWERDSLQVFEIDSASLHPRRQYALSIELSTNNNYPYRDIWLHVAHNLVDTLFQRDTLHVAVADERGKWLGTGVGGLHQLSIPYIEEVRPVERDSTTGYRVVIEQYMDQNPLVGVEKIGLKVLEIERANIVP